MFSLLQVIFLGIRLDNVVQWKWAVSSHQPLSPSLPPSLSLSLSHTHTYTRNLSSSYIPSQVVFIPTYLLLLGFLCGLVAYTSHLLYLHLSSSTSQLELQTRKMADILRVTLSCTVWLCTTIFTVSIVIQRNQWAGRKCHC